MRSHGRGRRKRQWGLVALIAAIACAHAATPERDAIRVTDNPASAIAAVHRPYAPSDTTLMTRRAAARIVVEGASASDARKRAGINGSAVHRLRARGAH